MPDLLLVFSKWWKTIVGLTVTATLITLVISLIVPKQYLSVATALPANSQMADKARIFNSNIEGLYSEFGTADDLDRIEGTGKLDTIYLAAVKQFDLTSHYKLSASDHAIYKAARRLKTNTDISKSGYGELKIKVWDTSPVMAADISNYLLQTIQSIHQQLQNENNRLVLERLRAAYQQKQKPLKGTVDPTASNNSTLPGIKDKDSTSELNEYRQLISQYDLAIQTNAPVLLTVEQARPAPWADKPHVLVNVLATFFAAFVFSFLLSFFMESRKLSE